MWVIPKTLQSPDPLQPLSFVQDTRAYISDLQEQSRICASSLFVRSKLSPLRTWLQKWKRDSWTQHLSGRILKPSLDERFVTKWTSLWRATHANPSLPLENAQEPMTQGISGLSSGTPSETCALEESSLRTSKDTSRLDSPQSSAIWKKMVTEQRGEYSQRLKSAPPTNGNGCLSTGNWPTIRASEYKDVGPVGSKSHDHMLGKRYLCATVTQLESGQPAPEKSSTAGSHRESVEDWPTMSDSTATGGPTGLGGGSGNRAKMYRMLGETEGKKMCSGKLNPRWVCTLMDTPVMWTEP